jgi:hypothetical protein
MILKKEIVTMVCIGIKIKQVNNERDFDDK